MSHRLHIVKCDFVLGGKEYSIFTNSPLGAGRHDLSLPFPIEPTVTGEPIEGSMISILPLRHPVRTAWVAGEDVIAKGTTSVVLTQRQVGHPVAVLHQPFCPHYPLLGFSTVFTATPPTVPLVPTVGALTFPEVVVEQQTIHFTRVFFPAHEGKSQVFIEKARSVSAEWVRVTELPLDELDYTPNGTDVDHFLRLAYTPVTNTGVEGPTVWAYSREPVIAEMPTFANAIIGGVAKTNHTLVALAEYYGGTRGKCSYDWYFSKHQIHKSHGITPKLQKVAENQQCFVPNNEMAEGFLAVNMVPVRSDDVVGDPVFCVLSTPLSLEDVPRVIPIQKAPVVAKTVQFNEQVDILLSKPTGYCGFEVLKSADSYTPREKHVGRIVRIVNDAVDQVVGEVIPAIPRILSVTIECDQWEPGQTVRLSVSHKHVKPDFLQIVWFREKGNFQKGVAIDVPEYHLTFEDVGYRIRAVAAPMDRNRHLLNAVYSSQSPPVIALASTEPAFVGELTEGETISLSIPGTITWSRSLARSKFTEISTYPSYTIQNADAGHFLRASVVTGNGVVLTVTSRQIVSPCEPSVELELPEEIHEGDTIKPTKIWHGGTEGKSNIRWFRDTDDGWDFISQSPTYTVKLEDVSSNLQLRYTPIRCDGRKGMVAIVECGPVLPGDPAVRNVSISQNEKGLITAVGEYSGGFEGFSFFVWRTIEGELRSNVGKTVEPTLVPAEKFVGKTMDVVYVPVRIDGLAGTPLPSANRIVVAPLPAVITAEILAKGGNLAAGSVVRCRAHCSPGAHPTFQWHRGDGTAWESIQDATGVEYQPQDGDVGFRLMCTVIAINAKDWPSQRFTCSTNNHIAAREKRLEFEGDVSKVETGRILVTTLTVEALAKAKLVWQRGEGETWESVITQDTYIVTCADIGRRIRAVAANGAKSDPTGIVTVIPVVGCCARSQVRARSFRFIGKSKLGAVLWNVLLFEGGINMENKNGTKKTCKWSTVKTAAVPDTTDELELWLDPATKFILIPTLEQRLESMVGKPNARDLVVLVIQGMKK
jgi:hypothetical protein